MTERTLQPGTMKDPIAETNTFADVLLAKDIFATDAEITQAIQGAIDNGVITYDLGLNGEEYSPGFHTRIGLDATDLRLGELSKYDVSGFNAKKFDELPLRNPADIAARAETAIGQEVVKGVARKTQWHLKDSSIRELVEGGRVGQYMKLEAGEDQVMDLVNFSDTPISVDQLNQIRETVQRVADLAGDTVFDKVSALCFVPQANLSSETTGGSFMANGGVVRLSEKLLTGEFEELYKADKPTLHEDDASSALKTTIAHELGHAIDIADSESNAFADSIGWSRVNHQSTDNYGNAVHVSKPKLVFAPFSVSVSGPAGTLQTNVKAKDFFGADQVEAARPVTNYAYTNAREDLAESFVLAVFDDGSLDPMRRSAIEGIMKRAGGKAVEDPIHISEADLSLKVGTDIRPAHYTIAEPVFSYNPSPREAVKVPRIRKDLEVHGYEVARKTVMDDYGNEVTGRAHAPSA